MFYFIYNWSPCIGEMYTVQLNNLIRRYWVRKRELMANICLKHLFVETSHAMYQGCFFSVSAKNMSFIWLGKYFIIWSIKKRRRKKRGKGGSMGKKGNLHCTWGKISFWRKGHGEKYRFFDNIFPCFVYSGQFQN